MKKKLLAAVISVIAAISVCTAFAVPAMAAINVYSPQGVAGIVQAFCVAGEFHKFFLRFNNNNKLLVVVI